MPQKLTERPEETIRQYLVDTLDPADIEGYDPQQTDTTATDFLPISNSWSKWGDYYPFIYVAEDSDPTVVGGGETNATGLQGDGSGVNQYAIHTVTISVQVAEGGAYRNGVEYDDLAQTIYSEVHHELQKTETIGDALWVGVPTPPTPTRNPGENDSDTLNWFQLSGTVPYSVHYTP